MKCAACPVEGMRCVGECPGATEHCALMLTEPGWRQQVLGRSVHPCPGVAIAVQTTTPLARADKPRVALGIPHCPPCAEARRIADV